MKPETKKRIAREILLFWTILIIALLTFGIISIYNYSKRKELEKIDTKIAEINKLIDNILIHDTNDLIKVWNTLNKKNKDFPEYEQFKTDMENDSLFSIVYERLKNRPEYSDNIEKFKKNKEENASAKKIRIDLLSKKEKLYQDRSVVKPYINTNDIWKMLIAVSVVWLILLYPIRGIIWSIIWAYKTLNKSK